MNISSEQLEDIFVYMKKPTLEDSKNIGVFQEVNTDAILEVLEKLKRSCDENF